MKWNPVETRSAFLRDEGALIQGYLNREFDANGSIGNCAIYNVYTVVKLWLSGLVKEIEPIFPQTIAWLDYAIEKEEDRLDGPYPLANAYRAKAMCKWLAYSQNDSASWKAAIVHYSMKLMDGKPSRGNLAKNYVEQILPACVFAGEYERGITEFEHFCGAKTLSLSKIWRPREFAYALCLHHSRGEFSKDELFAAGKKMLRSYVDDEWLHNGAFLEAAVWLKLVYSFGAPELTPVQTLLSVYDVMGEPLPDFVGEKKL